jgi:hypothetical protein
MQLQRLRQFVLRVGISNCCLFGRILWTALTLHEASESINLVLNPYFSNVLIKICCAVSSWGAMIAADTKALTLACWKKRKNERTEGRADHIWQRYLWSTTGAGVHSHKCLKIDPAKIIN